MKGIILAGGSGSRLYPITQGISKQLMPIYDKPMIYYPLSTLIEAGVNEILIITTPKDQDNFKSLLGDGSHIGCRFEYIVQPKPEGLAQAFILGEDFIGDDSVVLVLGDNIFYGNDLGSKLNAHLDPDGAVIFGYHVADPERYGVIEFDSEHNVLSLQEKPKKPRSNFAQTGLYFYDKNVVELAKQVKPSDRGELEITDLNKMYLKQGKLLAVPFEEGTAWLDTGTFESMMQAGQFVQVIEERQGLKIGCIEEAAYREGFITNKQLRTLAEPLMKSGYGKYLLRVAEEQR